MKDWIETTKIDKGLLEKTKQAINSAIKKNNLTSDKSYRSTTGEKSYQYDLVKIINQLDCLNEIKQITERLLKDKNLLKKEQQLEIMACWTVIGHEGTYHRIHRHNDYDFEHFSTVTYLEVSEEKDIGGCFYAVLRDENFENDFVEFQPEESDLLIFPVWVLHGTYPQLGKKRQTLSIDYRIKP